MSCNPSWRGAIRAAVGLALTIVAGGCQTSPPLQRTPYKTLAHKMEVNVGAAALGNFNTEFRVDSNDVNLGTFLDAETELGLGESATVGQFNVLYRFNRRHRIDLGFQNISRSGNTTLTEEIDFGNVTIPAVAVSTEFQTTTISTFYTYNFAVQERWEVGGQVGFVWSDLKLNISVNDDPLEAEANIAAPIPQFGLTGTFAISPKMRIGGAYQWLQLLFGDYQGLIATTRVNLDYDFSRHIGIGLGLVSYQSDADLTFSDFTGTLNYGYQGALFYLRGML